MYDYFQYRYSSLFSCGIPTRIPEASLSFLESYPLPHKKVIAPLSSSFQFFLVTWYTEHPENRDRTGANQFLFPGTLTLSSTMSISDFFF